MSAVLASPITKGAVSGLVSAAAVDLQAFRSWKSFSDAVSYNWRVAAWRWLQGAILGALGAAGYGAMVG
jgi:hypothetical protein